MPTHVPVQTIVPTPVVKLAPEREHQASLLEMVAYQAESDLLRLLGPYYRRAEDEGRTLIQNALASSADLQLTDTEFHVRLTSTAPPPWRPCDDLNARVIPFPGTKLRLRFESVRRRGPWLG